MGEDAEPGELRSGIVLPSTRENIELHTEDGLTLVGELATPLTAEPAGTLLTLHPLPTHGGFMDSHIYLKAANRLPALADLAVLRFNTRGTSSPRGTSDGEFGDGGTEAADFRAALQWIKRRGLPKPWVVGWSFGTEVALKHAWDARDEIAGVILLSPPLRRTTRPELARWADTPIPLVALVPEHDDFLVPDAAEAAFREAGVWDAERFTMVAVEKGRHLWIGEVQTRRVHEEIVRRVNPARSPLPTEWHGTGAE